MTKEQEAKMAMAVKLFEMKRISSGMAASVHTGCGTIFQWDYENQPAEIWDQYDSIVTEEEHYRIHPLLHFSELDIWRYMQRENIPFVSLYLSNQGKRYRSIGCVPCCAPVESTASTIDEIIAEIGTSIMSERAGRAQDKENLYTMQKLRSLGYM